MTCIPVANTIAFSESQSVGWRLWIDCATCGEYHEVIVEQDIMTDWESQRGLVVKA